MAAFGTTSGLTTGLLWRRGHQPSRNIPESSMSWGRRRGNRKFPSTGRVLLIDVLLDEDCKRAKRKGRSTVLLLLKDIAMVCLGLLKGESEFVIFSSRSPYYELGFGSAGSRE